MRHGNEDTFKDLMRIKRSVAQRFMLAPPDVKKIIKQVEEEL